MSDAIKIEKGVPLPPRYRKYPFADMNVGDSFFAPDIKAERLTPTAAYWQRKSGHKFACRTEAGGVRVWRVA